MNRKMKSRLNKDLELFQSMDLNIIKNIDYLLIAKSNKVILPYKYKRYAKLHRTLLKKIREELKTINYVLDNK